MTVAKQCPDRLVLTLHNGAGAAVATTYRIQATPGTVSFRRLAPGESVAISLRIDGDHVFGGDDPQIYWAQRLLG
jgi:hypothetical protein